MRVAVPFLLLIFGCRATFPPTSSESESRLTAQRLSHAKKIVITSDSGDIYTDSENLKFVFDEGGKSYCVSSRYGKSANGSLPPPSHGEEFFILPEESFQNVRRILLVASDILKIPEGHHGKAANRPRSFSICCDGSCHGVRAGSLPCDGLPEQYRAINDYLNDLLRQARKNSDRKRGR